MSLSLTDLMTRLQHHGQEHVLADWATLDPDTREQLATQLQSIDFDELHRLYERARSSSESLDLSGLEPLPVEEADRVSPETIATGEAALRAGEVAIILVAGGQGSRLNFDHPKGMFPIGPVTSRTLFDIHVGKVRALSRRYGVQVPLLIMTSPATDAETKAYFETRSYFGLPREQVTFFEQGTMPALDIDTGRLLMEKPGVVFTSPNGHGGTLTALSDTGLLASLQGRGVRTLFYFQVDNPMVKVADPAFLGRHIETGAELSTKVIDKAYPEEKMGVFAQINGRCGIIEYSDLPDELAQLTDPDGSLTYRAGNPAIHVFDVSFLDRVTSGADRLPFHVARKKVPYLDTNGTTIEPTEPNAFKFETFIFDAFPKADRWLAVRTTREEEFGPVKNADGADSPSTCQTLMTRQAVSWLRAVGVHVPDDVPVEIPPTFALDADELKSKVSPDLSIDGPMAFPDE